jgi:hypothetical protein
MAWVEYRNICAGRDWVPGIKAPDGAKLGAGTHGVNEHSGLRIRELFHEGYALALMGDDGCTFGQSRKSAVVQRRSEDCISALPKRAKEGL